MTFPFSPSSVRFPIVVAIVSVLLSACGKPPTEKLQGVWFQEGSLSRSIEFKSDGTAVLRVRKAIDGPIAHWTIVGKDKLQLTFDGPAKDAVRVIGFSLDGPDALTLHVSDTQAPAKYKRLSLDGLATLPPAPPQPWVYKDQARDASTILERIATSTSGETNDGATIDLTIRRRGADESIIALEAARALQPFACAATCEAVARFDDLAPQRYRLAPLGNSPSTLVFTDAAGLLEKLKASKRVVVEVPFAGPASRQFTFETADLRWP